MEGEAQVLGVQGVIHETGHALGLPDYYDYDPDSGPSGGAGGNLDMMDTYTACDHCGLSKFMLEWVTPTVVTTNLAAFPLRALALYPDLVAVMPGYDGGTPYHEFFLVENRNRVANDTNQVTDGLLIWHVDATPTSDGSDFRYDNQYAEHKLLRLMEADGAEEVEAGLDANETDFYAQGREFTMNSFPSSAAYDGRVTGIAVTNISAPGLTMTAAYSTNARFATQVRYVSPVGGNTPPYTDWATAALTLGDAFAAAAAGDTVLVSNGTYTLDGPISLLRNIGIHSVGGPGVTRINANGWQAFILSHEKGVVDGFTVTNGYCDYGGAAYIGYGEFTNCTLRSNWASLDGGAVYMNGGRLADCTVSDNVAERDGGGVWASYGTIKECDILGNWAATNGGGICADSATWVMSCALTSNEAYLGGGALAGADSGLWFCSLEANSATYGGGLYLRDGGTAEDSTLCLNTAIFGGAACIESNGALARCVVISNAAADPSRTYWPCGGGVYCDGGGRLENDVLVYNQADFGAGIYVLTTALVQNCTLSRNTAVREGGGLYCDGGGLIRNTVVWGNSAGTGADYRNSGLGAFYSNSCLSSTPLSQSGTVLADPAFLNTNGDFHLTGTSSCLDVGSADGAPTQDVEQVIRPLDGDANGTRDSDIGAYEYVSDVADSDADGLDDYSEIYVHGANPLASDTDGDRFRDGDEVKAGTGPLDPASFLGITGPPTAFWSVPDNGFVLEWASVDGIHYTVGRSTNRMPPLAFDPIAFGISGQAGTARYTDTNSPPHGARYRITAE